MSSNPKSPEDIPSGIVYAILTTISVHIPGDERSRTNPGHGYPASSEDHWDIETFATREEWEREINRRMAIIYRQPFKAVVMQVPKIETKTVVTVEIKGE